MSLLRNVAACLLATLPTLGVAGNFSISPIRLDLSAREGEAVVIVRNLEATAVTVQVRPVRWTIHDNAEQYEPTRDLLAAPLIFTLDGNAEQVVRIALRRPPTSPSEAHYRLFFSELPAPAQAGSGAPTVRMLLNVGIPVFVEGSTSAQPQLRWQAQFDGSRLRVQVTNQGSAHARVTRVTLNSDDGRAIGTVESNNYVLPGSARWWDFDTSRVARVRLSALIDETAVSHTLDVVER